MSTFIAPAPSTSTPTASKFNLLELGALPAATKKIIEKNILNQTLHEILCSTPTPPPPPPQIKKKKKISAQDK